MPPYAKTCPIDLHLVKVVYKGADGEVYEEDIVGRKHYQPLLPDEAECSRRVDVVARRILKGGHPRMIFEVLRELFDDWDFRDAVSPHDGKLKSDVALVVPGPAETQEPGCDVELPMVKEDVSPKKLPQATASSTHAHQPSVGVAPPSNWDKNMENEMLKRAALIQRNKEIALMERERKSQIKKARSVDVQKSAQAEFIMSQLG